MCSEYDEIRGYPVTARPKSIEIGEIEKQVERALKDGSIDAEFESSRGVRQEAMDALIKSEHFNPEKLRRRIDI